MNDGPENGFDVFAQLLIDKGSTLEEARDYVIGRCLKGGDTGAFIYFETLGHTPGREVLRLLSVMMSERISSQNETLYPFTLTSKRRSGTAGRRSDPMVDMRDELIALNVKALMDAGQSLEAACSAVALIISSKIDINKGHSVKNETVRKAYLRHASALR